MVKCHAGQPDLRRVLGEKTIRIKSGLLQRKNTAIEVMDGRYRHQMLGSMGRRKRCRPEEQRCAP